MCTGDTYKSLPGSDACTRCPDESTMTGSTYTSAAGCACHAGTYGVPGDAVRYRIVRADGTAGAVEFASFDIETGIQ